MSKASAYTVFARKYRPKTFHEMIGQDALVQTLSNAIDQNRVAHAYILTGVRGVGKTTTARLVARGLNCSGEDGQGLETIDPCGVCASCTAILSDSHMDVIEVDAASRTGVDDVRDLIEGVRYKPVKGRYKIYIIDEVHMLSKSAFNALLKTLEEPPEHVKFIFATTEIRKVPVTILSRCQRFDLKRVDVSTLETYFAHILTKENVAFVPEALTQIAKAADGSVRDGLSLLDQAVSLTDGNIQLETIERMLGMANRQQVLALLDALWAGDVAVALKRLSVLYKFGGEPELICQDLLSLVHEISLFQVVGIDATHAGEDIQKYGETLSVPVLTRAWQLLLKGLQEVRQAPLPQSAFEMILIRFCYIQDVPLLRQQGAPAVVGIESSPAEMTPIQQPKVLQTKGREEPDIPKTFLEIIALFEAKKEPIIAAKLYNDVHLISYAPQNLVLRLSENIPQNFLKTVRMHLDDWTKVTWSVSSGTDEGALTLRAQKDLEKQQEINTVIQEAKIQEVLAAFPDAQVEEIENKKIGDF